MKKQGFTLIELLVVIAIIGILAAIGVTAFGGVQSKARDSKRTADLGALAASLTLYYDANNAAYPLNATAGLVTASANMTTASQDTTNGFSIPRTPQAGTLSVNDYWYVTSAAGERMALFTRLENGNFWFVNNSRGFSDKITSSNTGVPSGTTADCALSAGAGTTYHPCYPLPVM